MKTHTTSRLAALFATLVLVFAVATPAYANVAGSQVNASVELAEYCVNLDLGDELTFGSAGLSEAVPELNDSSILIRNSGAGAARVMIQGTDATGPSATWRLADEVGRGVFSWYLTEMGDGATGNPIYVSTSPRVLKENLGYLQSVAFSPTLLTPNCTPAGGVYTWSATIYAVPLAD